MSTSGDFLLVSVYRHLRLCDPMTVLLFVQLSACSNDALALLLLLVLLQYNNSLSASQDI